MGQIGFLRTIVEEYSEEKSPLIRETRPPSNFSIPDIPWTIIHDFRRRRTRGQGFANIESSRWKINAFAKWQTEGGGGCTRARMPASVNQSSRYQFRSHLVTVAWPSATLSPRFSILRPVDRAQSAAPSSPDNVVHAFRGQAHTRPDTRMSICCRLTNPWTRATSWITRVTWIGHYAFVKGEQVFRTDVPLTNRNVQPFLSHSSYRETFLTVRSSRFSHSSFLNETRSFPFDNNKMMPILKFCNIDGL